MLLDSVIKTHIKLKTMPTCLSSTCQPAKLSIESKTYKQRTVLTVKTN